MILLIALLNIPVPTALFPYALPPLVHEPLWSSWDLLYHSHINRFSLGREGKNHSSISLAYKGNKNYLDNLALDQATFRNIITDLAVEGDADAKAIVTAALDKGDPNSFPSIDLKTYWPFVLPDYTPPFPSFAFPSRLGWFFGNCVLITMAFYNMFLCSAGHTWSAWSTRVTKLVLPRFKEGLRSPLLVDTYPERPPAKPPRAVTRSSHSRARATAALLFTAISSTVAAHPFELKSELQFTQRLRQYRSCLGHLQTNKLTPIDRVHLHERINISTLEFNQSVSDHSSDIVTGVVDSGASHGASNRFEDCDPKTIKRLSEPITLDGIAGGLKN